MSQKPNLLIFGGLYGMAQAALKYLVPANPNERLIAHVRVRDKYSLSPPTTYVGKDFLAFLEERKGVIEYKQANLTNPAVVAQCFDEPAPDGRPYTHVLDFSGNLTFTHSTAIQVVQTFNVGMNIAREAQRHDVKALVRHQPPWYEHLDVTAKYTEEDPKGWKPMPLKGVWWHETLRAMGSIPGLPFCVVRCGYAYGPGLYSTEPLTATIVGYIYKHLGIEAKLPWSPKMRKNTIHSADLVVALWNVMEWMASTGRDTANSVAGVKIPPSNDPEVASVPEAISSGDVIVPAFNAVDDGDTTMQSLSDEIAKIFGLKVGFYGEDILDLQSMSESEFIAHINDIHIQEWSKIITNANPPVPHTPLTPWAQTYQFKERGCALDGSKLKNMFSFRPEHPKFDESTIREWIEWCRQQGIWPEGPLYT